MNISKQIGLKIKEMRTVQKITQEELSKGIVNRSFISQLEKGMVSPSIETLEKLAERLNCTISYLIGQSERDSAIEQLNIISVLDNIESYINEGLIEKAKQTFNSFSGEWIEKMNTYERGKFYWVKAKLKWFEEDYEGAENFTRKAIDLLKDNYSNQLGKLYNFLGMTVFRLQNIEEAFKSFSSAMYYTHQYPSDYNLKIETYLNMGVYHTHLREYQTAIFYLKNALANGDSHSTLYKIGEVKMTLGISYKHLGNIKEAIDAYLDAAHIFTIKKENDQLAGVYFNLGLLYRKNFNIKESTDYFNKAKTLFLQKQNVNYIYKCEIQLIKNLIHLQDINKALEHWNSLKKSKDRDYEVLLLDGIFHLYNYKNNLSQEELLKGIHCFKEASIFTNDKEYKTDFFDQLNKYVIQEGWLDHAKEILSDFTLSNIKI